MIDSAAIQRRHEFLNPILTEQSRRWWAAAEALVVGRGGKAAVARATGVSRRAIAVGAAELADPARRAPAGRVRRSGGGRKRTVALDPKLREDLERLVEPVSRGDPESPLRWTCKSVRKLAEELRQQGHQTSHRMVAALLHELGYSLQANRKVLEGSQHPDRNAQFEHLNRMAQLQLEAGEPVISVDTKKKELVGAFKNGGREWQPTGQPEPVNVYDYPSTALGRATPYGVYDVGENEGWVSVGVDHDTASFAVESIRRWWQQMGQVAYPQASRLLISADGGGSNGYRVRLWKLELQQLADQTGLEVMVCHLPPGTSKWNKIEHRLFAFISHNWRGRPLLSYEVVVNLIAATTTTGGLRVQSQLDTNAYPAGRVVRDEEYGDINLRRDPFHGEWNYRILPRPTLNL